MRRVRLVMGGSIVGHVEFRSFSPGGHPDYQCIPDGILSDPDARLLRKRSTGAKSWGGRATVTGKPSSKPPPPCRHGRWAVAGTRTSDGGLAWPTPFPPSRNIEKARRVT